MASAASAAAPINRGTLTLRVNYMDAGGARAIVQQLSRTLLQELMADPGAYIPGLVVGSDPSVFATNLYF